VELEVVDPRTLKPLDVDTIAESVRKTGRLIVVNEGARAGGFASEVVARTLDHVAVADLRATPVRVTAKDTPIPYSAALEREVLPSLDDVLDAVARVMRS
jgi:pyruvate dehydrogenase E1 component beta subunit